ncbi:MAG: transglutaminase-like domain-containing protein [candidate division WOR-3 bacterium]|nr:transglutaminase-like domain-containing protein [candidate division WOR-3 bacterium]MCX7756791.1 transglutaminase-like domain-containing protein [candidate division WOR-3 bacterium]MDW7987562.1 transglutaminase-like domain-containing protein [candidate division WOR-3 bacterium]
MRSLTRLILISLLAVFINTACRHRCPSITQSSETEQWRMIYLQNRRIGYSYLKIAKIKDGYQITERFRMKLGMLGKSQEIITEFIGVTDLEYALKNFSYLFKSPDQSFTLLGKITEKKVILESGDNKILSKEIPLATENIYCNAVLGRLIAHKKFKIPSNFTVKLIEPTVATIIDAQLNILGKEKIEIDGRVLELTKVSCQMLGLTSYLWLNESGTVKKEWSSPDMISIETTSDDVLAQSSLAEQLDILDLYAIPAETTVYNPRQVKWAEITFTNFDTSGFSLHDDFQRVTNYNPIKIEINSKLEIKDVLFPIDDNREYLRSSFYVQSEHPEIIAMARKIVGTEKSATRCAEKILNWVYKMVKKEPSATIPQSIEVLKKLRGDCNEHAVLYCALARAIGIPTEICVGLVYLDGKFYYHAWNKVYLGEWVAVDPTFGQFPADALHIKLSEGELSEQSKVLKIIGKVKLKIISYR